MKIINIIVSSFLTLGVLFYLAGNLTVYCSKGILTDSISCIARLYIPK
jgi:hypothetical protein